MPFRARIFIQGVGVYVPSPDHKKLEVLFPDSSQPHLGEGEKLTDSKGEPFRKHKAVMQYSARNQDPKAKDEWLSFSVRGHRLRVESNSKKQLTFAGGGETLLGLPILDDCLVAADLPNVKAVDPALVKTATAAQLELTAGVVGPDSEYLGVWQWVDHHNFSGLVRYAEYASVMRVELGEVSELTLVLEPMDGHTPAQRVKLGPAAGFCDVWVRHDCNVERRPEPDQSSIRAGDPDLDFLLNFALTSDPGKVRRAKLPIPSVHTSWKAGSPIGGDPQKCMAAQTKS